MVEIKVVLPPEIHRLLKDAQAQTGVARQDVAIGAFLTGDLAELAKHGKPEGVANIMFGGLPRMMEVLGEAVEPIPKTKSKRKPTKLGRVKGKKKATRAKHG